MTLIKRVSSFTANTTAVARLVSLLEQVDGRRPGLLRVLTYHRVDELEAHPGLNPALISATPQDFDQQMRYLATNYHVVSMADVLNAYRTETDLPPRSVMVTFDDAYRDFQEHAWPTLRRYGLPATLFVPTAFPDHPEQTFWWDRLHQAVWDATGRDDIETPVGRLPIATPTHRGQAVRRLTTYVKTLPHREAMALIERIGGELDAAPTEHSVLGWDALRRLAREGVTVGAHTRTHPLLNRIACAEARAEVVGSINDLKREIGSVLPIFAYPSGALSDDVVRVLEREEVMLAFTTARGINTLRDAHRLRLQRINVGRRTTLTVLRAQLLPSISTLGHFS